MNKLQELSVCISETEHDVEITMSKENFDKINNDLERLEKLDKVLKIVNDKNVDLRAVKVIKGFKGNYEVYNELFTGNHKELWLTKEEFKFIRKIMGR